MSDHTPSAATPSARTLHWFGDKSREELLLEIDRIITTDKPALAKLYERLDDLDAENQRLRNYVAVIASGMPREDLIAIEREFGEPVDGRLPS